MATSAFSSAMPTTLTTKRTSVYPDVISMAKMTGLKAQPPAAGLARWRGTAGLLAGLGLMAIPGVGPIVAAGWLVAALTGAAAGGATGGIIGALSQQAGLSEEDRKSMRRSAPGRRFCERQRCGRGRCSLADGHGPVCDQNR